MLKIKGAAGGLDWLTTHLTAILSFPLAFLSFAAFPSLPFCNLKGPRPYKTVVNCTKTLASSPSLQANYFLIPVMSPKMLIYAEVNLHEWAQPRGQTHPSWVKLFPGWQEKSGRDVGGLPPLLPAPFPALIIVFNCWLPRWSIGNAGLMESLLLVADLLAHLRLGEGNVFVGWKG